MSLEPYNYIEKAAERLGVNPQDLQITEAMARHIYCMFLKQDKYLEEMEAQKNKIVLDN